MKRLILFMVICPVLVFAGIAQRMQSVAKKKVAASTDIQLVQDGDGTWWEIPNSVGTNNMILAHIYPSDPAGTYVDYSASDNDGTQATSGYRPAFTTNNGGRVYFDGTDDCYDLASNPAIDSSDFSVVVWAYIIDDGNDDCFIGRDLVFTGGSQYGWWFVGDGKLANKGGLLFRRNEGDATLYTAPSSDTNITFGAWNMYSVTYDVDTGNTCLYFGTTPDSGNPQTLGTGSIAYDAGTDQDTNIGVRDFGGTPERFTESFVGFIGIFDKTLSASEITNVYHSTTNRY